MNKNADKINDDPQPKLYSILDQVDGNEFRSLSDGKFHYKLVYPGLGFIEWKQDNPISSTKHPTGFEKVDANIGGSRS